MSNIIDKIQLSGVTYDIQGSGGGKAIEAGRGIYITTGETADTVSFDLPISAGTGTNSIVEGQATTASGDYSHAEGAGANASGSRSHAEGDGTVAEGYTSHAEGSQTTASGFFSHAEGYGTIANNDSEHASGQYNVSSSASTRFGNSGNTLFSVGNGTADNARHNAFEIRQNGNIYITSGGTDILLQDHLGGGGGNPTVELTQAEYDALVSAGTVSADTYYIITDAQAGDLTNYYTKTEVDNAITAATSTKQDTLVSGTNIKTINNESILGSGNIDIQGGGGGGKAVSGGTNISITTGETADTINCTLPFSYEGDNLKTTVSGNSFVNYFHYGQIFGVNNTLQGRNSDISNAESGSTIIGNGNQILRNTNSIVIGSSNSLGNIFGMNNQNYVFGYSNTLNPAGTNDNIINNNFVIGNNNVINKKNNNFIFGYGIKPSNDDEFALGKYNNSVSASTTFGDGGNTLFSVGNGTADNARHNAFEIRQNGDIYLNDGTNDVKLQDTITATAANTTALGGLSLVKLTQAEYDALATKDNNTLYVIVN